MSVQTKTVSHPLPNITLARRGGYAKRTFFCCFFVFSGFSCDIRHRDKNIHTVEVPI